MSSRYNWIIRGGLVVSGERIEPLDLGIHEGKVIAVASDLRGTARREIDATGKYVLPGLLDVHTHPLYVDDVTSLSRSAAYGGITTVIYYAYAERGRSAVTTAKEFLNWAKADSLLDYGVHMGFFEPAAQVSQIPKLIELGITSFKFFMCYSRIGRMCDDYQLLRAFDIIADAGGLGMVHAENGLATDYLEDKFNAEGRDPAEVFVATRPGILEAEAVNRAICLAQVAGCPIYIPHVSAKEAVEVIAQAKARGWRVYGETCPQYLTLTGEEVFRQGPLAKIGPPLRGKEDQEALWRGLTQGVLDVIASDHAPKEKKKTDDFFQAAYGSPQVETMVEVVYEAGVNGGKITLPRLVQVMSENPAKIFGLYPRKGALAVGSDADLVIFDPQLEHTITGEEQHSNAPYTLYEGWRCLGRPVFSLQRGEVILEEGEVVAEAGRGKFLLPTQAGKVDPKDLV